MNHGTPSYSQQHILDNYRRGSQAKQLSAKTKDLFFQLESNLNNPATTQWVNIQGVVRQTFQEVLALCADQQSQIDRCAQMLDSKISLQEL